jgi:BirA family biotin operon repressor/biotin-[acetyl-CoA-carboxylase] ligase
MKINKKDLIENYRNRLNMLGREIKITTPNDAYTAFAVDTDEAGRLIVRMQNGETRILSSGEVSVNL